MITDRIIRFNRARTMTTTMAVAMALALALSACGGSADEGGVVAADSGDVAVESPEQSAGSENAQETPADNGSTEQPPADEGLASVPALDPDLEIEVGDTTDIRAMALSADASLVAVLGGGRFTEVDDFLRVYDTTTGDLTSDISLDGQPEMSSLFWTADNRIVGIDIVSIDPLVLTWDGGTFDFVGSFPVDDFVCLSGINAFDPVAGAVFAFEYEDGGTTMCRRDLASDTVIEARPLDDGQDLESLKLRGDNSELVSEVWDNNTQQYLTVQFDPTTLAVIGEEVSDPNVLVGVGLTQDLIADANFSYSLQPSGIPLGDSLTRPQFSPDGSWLWVVDDRDDVELLVDVATGERVGQIEIGRGHLYHAWATDGSLLIIPALDTTLRVFRP